MPVDPTLFLGVVEYVVRGMNIPPHLVDEAKGEATLALVTHARDYDPTRRVSPEAFLTQRLRWWLHNWRTREIRRYDYEVRGYAQTASMDSELCLELNVLITLAQGCLNTKYYMALVGEAYGLTIPELCSMLETNGKQLKIIREEARYIIKQELRLL